MERMHDQVDCTKSDGMGLLTDVIAPRIEQAVPPGSRAYSFMCGRRSSSTRSWNA
jgi:hypothetical protein